MEDFLIESWSEIIGYEGLYAISNHGNVVKLNHNNSGEPKKMIVQYDQNSYPFVTLRSNGRSKLHYIHRLVALHFVPNPNNYPYVLKKDDNKLHYQSWNLEWSPVKNRNN